MFHRKDWVCTSDLIELLNTSVYFSPEKSPWRDSRLWIVGGHETWVQTSMLVIRSMQEEGFEDWPTCLIEVGIDRSNSYCGLCRHDFWDDQAVWFIDDGSNECHACFRCTIDVLALEKSASRRVDFLEYLASTTSKDRIGQTYFASGLWDGKIVEIHCTDSPADAKPECRRCNQPIVIEDGVEHWAWRMYTDDSFENVHARCVSELDFFIKETDLLSRVLNLVNVKVAPQSSIETRLSQVKELLEKQLITEEEAKVKRDDILKNL